MTRERFLFFFAKIIILEGFVFLPFFLPKAQAVQVKKVQSGIVEFSAEDIARIVSIREVDTSKTIILISVETASTHDYGSFFVPDFYDSKTIYVSRSKKEKPAKIGWTIIEFDEGVFVQRGSSDVPEGILERVTSIPQSVSPAKSFIITYPKSS
ncbi:MAG: hypothetical protein NG737_00435, partial [Omnitrophica bacterium]|nr:hypothetical protein [Candidatus Omnitrophota bacterium]